MRYALIVTCDYLPQSGTGITRVTKLFKYLPDFDWQPVVLTTHRYGSLPTDKEQQVHREGDPIHTLFSPLRWRRIQGVSPESQHLVATMSNQSFFGRVADDLHKYIEEIKPGFPDCVARRFTGKGWERVLIEFEFASSNFRAHGHHPDECDIMVSWEHYSKRFSL